MAYRPNPLPRAAVRVINASHVLSDIEKLVWCEIRVLDRSEKGCYIKPATLAKRLGRSLVTIKRSRQRLQDLGVVYRVERTYRSWYPRLPEQCIPQSSPGDDQVFRLAVELDRVLIERSEIGVNGDPKSQEFGIRRNGKLVSSQEQIGITSNARPRTNAGNPCVSTDRVLNTPPPSSPEDGNGNANAPQRRRTETKITPMLLRDANMEAHVEELKRRLRESEGTPA